VPNVIDSGRRSSPNCAPEASSSAEAVLVVAVVALLRNAAADAGATLLPTICSAAFTPPRALGANATSVAQVAPAASVAPQVPPVITKSGLVVLAAPR
jgi:hypothetical protein